MNISLKITERDKKFLSFAAALSVACVLIILVVRPLWIAKKELEFLYHENENAMLEASRREHDVLEMEKQNVDKQLQLKELQKQMYPVMRSNAIDRELSRIIKEHGLQIVQLKIIMPEAADRNDTKADGSLVGNGGIFTAKVAMEISGDSQLIDQLIDDIAITLLGMRCTSLSWLNPEDGLERVAMNLEIYMGKEYVPK